jgi:hypothetical protein
MKAAEPRPPFALRYVWAEAELFSLYGNHPRFRPQAIRHQLFALREEAIRQFQSPPYLK